MIENNTYKCLFGVIKKSLWNTGIAYADQETYEEMKMHRLLALPASVIRELSLPDELFNVWKKAIISQVREYCIYTAVQASLPIAVPYVILKGTSAAKYYPYPEYRTMGDIDIMTRREDFETACDMLISAGYEELNSGELRHREFVKNGIIVEIHRYFASLNDPGQAEYLDNLIIENINPSHVLPDMVNGLVLLEHISQHLEHGLGLRQIIDWMMFVNACLPDSQWPEFRQLAQNIGMENLAITTTRMCEIYMALPSCRWCKNADEDLCEDFMEYILNAGNFGNKWENDSSAGTKVLTYSRTPVAAYRFLQKNGLKNWKLAQDHPALKPFAWIYQAGKYIGKGLGQKNAASKLKEEFESARERNALLDALGVKQTSKGLAVFKDGKYVKN